MQTKQALTVIGSFLFLYGVFGYVFPLWGDVTFTNNENLFHLLTGILAVLLANAAPPHRVWALLLLALIYLILGISAFTLTSPTDYPANRVAAQFDQVDNYLHIAFGLTFAWFWLQYRRKAI